MLRFLKDESEPPTSIYSWVTQMWRLVESLWQNQKSDVQPTGIPGTGRIGKIDGIETPIFDGGLKGKNFFGYQLREFQKGHTGQAKSNYHSCDPE